MVWTRNHYTQLDNPSTVHLYTACLTSCLSHLAHSTAHHCISYPFTISTTHVDPYTPLYTVHIDVDHTTANLARALQLI